MRKAFSDHQRGGDYDPVKEAFPINEERNERRGRREPVKDDYPYDDPYGRHIDYSRDRRDDYRGHGRREWDQISVDDSVVDYGRRDSPPPPELDTRQNWSYGGKI